MRQYLSSSIWLLIVLTSMDNTEASICRSINVRNTPELLRTLEGCTVVEGFVKIALMERANESDFEPYSFPELREITQFLMFFRVKGLRTLGKLFPNLEKIGGDNLFWADSAGFALVVAEMFSLQEVGLESLKEISRGSVIFFKNPSLCYVNTVDWDGITKRGAGKNYAAHNKDPENCPSCPEGCATGHCWSDNQCQVEEGKVGGCHHLCVGGCFHPGPNGCYSCRGVLDPSGNCVQHCPKGTYQYLNRRCVTREVCLSTALDMEETLPNKNGSKSNNIHQENKLRYLIFENECLDNCPLGFEINARGEDCVPCVGGLCPKWCKGAEVKTMEDAQALKGCTLINGSLEIVIRTEKSETVSSMLEENLGSIEEITGHLKVTRSSVINLKFLKNLTLIRGADTNANYALLILDNQNLQELWDWQTKINFTVLNGRLYFHYNPKLCLQHIYNLLNVIHYETNVSNFEISKDSNGDKFSCNLTEIQISVTFKTFNVIQVHVPCVRINSTPVLRYVLYYTKAPYRNITMFDDRDQCSDHGWKTKDISIDANDSYSVAHGFLVNLTDLEPYTQYVFYVTTYVVSSIGAKSRMNYESTLPTAPSELTQLIVFSNSSSDITLKWEPPKHVNGKLEQYIVSWSMLKDAEYTTNLRNYCTNPMDWTTETKLQNQNTPKTEIEKEISCVKTCLPLDQLDHLPKDGFEELCSNYKGSLLPIGFPDKVKFPSCESYFYSYIYKSPFQNDITRNKRQNEISPEIQKNLLYDDPNLKHRKTKFQNTHASSNQNFYIKDNKTKRSRSYPANSFGTTISSLKHFQTYAVTVKACRESQPEEANVMEDLRCSKTEIAIVRTWEDRGADKIPDRVRHVVSQKTVSIWWDAPESPNGAVLAFEIEYKLKNRENFNQFTECITFSQYEMNNREYSVVALSTGSYEFRIRAVTLAGKGPFTPYTQFDIVDDQYSPMEILFITIVVVIFVGLIFLITYFFRIQNIKNGTVMFTEVNPNYQYVSDHFEVRREDVEFSHELGVGSFGKVFEGVLKPENVRCAIKTLNDDATEESENEFLSEATIMKSMTKAYYVVNLLGVVSKGRPPLVLMELMELGDLKSYLRSMRDICILSNGTMIKMATEIADAMAFMEAHKFVHRDLAARNCMVGGDLTIKVGDFGMTRDIYETDYYRKKNKGLLPIRWMAPESLRDGEFTSKSDVWSYGVVLWEIATMAEQPYQGLSNDQVLHDVIEGARLDVPKNCSFPLKPIISSCWGSKPSKRSSFMGIVGSLGYYHEEEFKKLSYYHSSEGIANREGLWEYVEMQSVEDPFLDLIYPDTPTLDEDSVVSLPPKAPQLMAGGLTAVQEEDPLLFNSCDYITS